MRRYLILSLFLLPAVTLLALVAWCVTYQSYDFEIVTVVPPPSWPGRVVDFQGKRIASARVSEAGQAKFVTTDANGEFSLSGFSGRLPLVVHKDGYYLAVLPSRFDRAELRPLPTDDCASYKWVSPTPHWDSDNTSCGRCHTAIYKEWNGGAHAGSVTSQHFRDLYDGGKGGWNLLKEHPQGAGVCAACHAPTVAMTAENQFDLRAAFRSPRDELNSVHCDYCHKIVGSAEGEVGLTHGRYGLKLLRPESGQLFFGPLNDANRNDNAYSPFQKSSRLCALCHEGIVFGIRVYSTYSEWLDSPAGKSGIQCQQCHMKPTGTMTNFAPSQGGIDRDATTLANHRFFDGSHDQMLKRCLKLKVEATRDANGVSVAVELLAEGVGHRVPTGFVDRNIVLSIEAADAGGKPQAHSDGPIIPRTKAAGRLYAKQLKDFDGKSPVPFWLADPELIDTRLKPGEPDRSVWRFPSAATTVHVRMIYRRFWPEVATEKGWIDNEMLIHERDIRLP